MKVLVKNLLANPIVHFNKGRGYLKLPEFVGAYHSKSFLLLC